MSDLLVLGLKLLFLTLLWLFVLFAINVIRTDVFGRRVAASTLVSDAPAASLPPSGTPSAAPSRRFGRRKPPLPSVLHITGGAQAGQSIVLDESTLIGRTPDANLVLHDQYMSTRHALITRTNQGYVVEDLGSTNGTFLNERRLTGPTAFGADDTLRIGHTTMALGD